MILARDRAERKTVCERLRVEDGHETRSLTYLCLCVSAHFSPFAGPRHGYHCGHAHGFFRGGDSGREGQGVKSRQGFYARIGIQSGGRVRCGESPHRQLRHHRRGSGPSEAVAFRNHFVGGVRSSGWTCQLAIGQVSQEITVTGNVPKAETETAAVSDESSPST